MPSLPEIQAGFVAAVLGRGDASVPRWILAGPVAPEERLAVYRNNARENFAAALQAGFPAVARLMGRDEFLRMAWAYQRQHPSPSGNLFHVGERLPAFLAAQLANTTEQHLAGMARLEWLAQEAIVAPDTDETPDLPALVAVPPERYAELRFRLHPAVRLLDSPYPVFQLWAALRSGGALYPPGDSPAAHGVDPDGGGEAVLVRRVGGGVEVHRLRPAEYSFLDAVARGMDFDSSLDLALSAAGDFDPGGLLERMARLKVIVGFEI